MSRLILFGCAAITLVVCLAAVPASAQPRERSRGGDRRDGDSRRDDDPAAFLKRFDANGNGTIDPDEVSGRMKNMIDSMAQRAGLDPSKPMPLDKLAEAMRSGRSAPGESRDSNSKPAESPAAAPAAGPAANGKTPTVPGFGSEDKTPKASGFGTPLANGSVVSSEKRYSKQVTDYVDRMLLDYDKNKDNVLDAEEMKNVRFQSDPKESDLNKDGKLDRHELLERIAKRFGANTSNSDDRRRGPSGPPSPPSSSQSSDLDKVKEWAKGYVKEKDTDGSGMLERVKGEWEKVSSENQKADGNGDGVITADELFLKASAFARTDSGSTKPASSGGPPPSGPPPSFGSPRSDRETSRNPGSSSKASSSAKKTYRPIPPTERLPKNLPDWFLRSDENEDGQISMAEYAALWSDSKATEFASYDLDGDGIVTAKECLKKTEKK